MAAENREDGMSAQSMKQHTQGLAAREQFVRSSSCSGRGHTQQMRSRKSLERQRPWRQRRFRT
jgi:hypothetical protein